MIIVIGYLGQQIQNYFGPKCKWQNRPVKYVTQHELNGTAGALLIAKPLLRDTFLVLNGDDLYAQQDLGRLIAVPEWGWLAAATTRSLAAAVNVGYQGYITGFMKDQSHNKKWLTCGAYWLNQSFLTLNYEMPLSLIKVYNDSVCFSQQTVP